MAIQWADDFSRYGTGTASRTAMLDGLPYSSIGGNTTRGQVVADPDPNITGRCFQVGNIITNNNNGDFSTAYPTVVSGTAGFKADYWFSALSHPSANTQPHVFQFQIASAAILLQGVLQANGSVIVSGRIGGVLTQVADSVNPIISPSSWNSIEVSHNVATGAGSLFINGIQRMTWNGVQTDYGSIAILNMSARSNLGTPEIPMYVKNFVLWDGTGSVNNAPLGNVQVRRLKPNADIALGDWTPSTGSTGFNLLAKDAVNDTTYLSVGNTLPSADMRYDFENLPPDVTSVLGLIFVHRSRKTDGGDGNIQTALSPDGTNWDNGADRPITTAFQYDFDVSELDPATSAAWTPVGVDALDGRIDRTL